MRLHRLLLAADGGDETPFANHAVERVARMPARPLTAERPRPHTPTFCVPVRAARKPFAASVRGGAPTVKGLWAASPAGW